MDTLQAILDRQAIEDLLVRYGEIHDTKAFDALSDVFTDEVEFSIVTTGLVAPFANDPVAHSIRELTDLVKQGIGPDVCGVTHCNITNVRVAVHGDTAESSAHHYTMHQSKTDPAGFYTVWGDYQDWWRRTPKGWRISRRVLGMWADESKGGTTRGLV